MGQQSDSGRRSELDDKKMRAAGRQQNDPARRAITGHEEQIPPVGGAFGKNGKVNRVGPVAGHDTELKDEPGLQA
jgi:hypothetical protein